MARARDDPPSSIRDAQMNATDVMLAEFQARRPGMSLDRKFYTDPEFYRLDLETLFYRDWLFAGHDCEIPAPGDYFTIQIGDYPIIVLRGRDGAIRALHNTCRHRGSRICSAAKGAAKRLVCPYHQWTYDLDGSLIRARHQDGRIRQGPIRSQACPLRKRRRLYLRLPRAGRAELRAISGATRSYCRRTGSPTPGSPSRARSSRTATGSWCGRTIASAITAPRTIRSCCGHFPSGRPFQASATPSKTAR